MGTAVGKQPLHCRRLSRVAAPCVRCCCVRSLRGPGRSAGSFSSQGKVRTGQYASLIVGRAHTSECIGKADSGYSMACAPLPFLLSIPQRSRRPHAARAAPPAVAVWVDAYSVFYPSPPQARTTRPKSVSTCGGLVTEELFMRFQVHGLVMRTTHVHRNALGPKQMRAHRVGVCCMQADATRVTLRRREVLSSLTMAAVWAVAAAPCECLSGQSPFVSPQTLRAPWCV
jgi:hypothetical protein